MSTVSRKTTDGADAFQRLYAANYQRVLRFLARIAGPQEAEDLAQMRDMEINAIRIEVL